MKRTRKDKRKDFFLSIIRQFAKIWMFFDGRSEYIFEDGFDRKRKEPYVLLANHTFVFDVVHVPLRLRRSPFIVANKNLFTKQPLKFLLEEVAHAIPKSKGTSDIRTAKDLIGAVRRGYPICIFPEGNTTFNGETNYIEESTMKLIKKLKIDVVACKVQGGYLSKPRWATGKRRNRSAKYTYKIIIGKDEVKDLSVEEINEIVNRELYNNDYEYQKEVMIKHPGKNKAEGLENILYICPECESFGTLSTKGDHIYCSHCNAKGKVNDYGFIEGMKFDNTVDWDNWQRKFDDALLNQIIESPASIYDVNDENLSREFLGNVTLKYEDRKFIVSGAINLTMPFDDIKNPIVTLRRNFNINYKDKHYLIKVEQYVTSFLRVIQSKY
ncbi:2-acyl-glycerophospho-ethanolamine acyltransferase [Candidatus Izimaplasma bacterium HR1]|jgi:1-acyl-sn-glycerol-3-phosphate acyltransferase|uniref:lysophospholipid acyltransferase family protein n=1 Tax=Candidatus Izimoplasma sp. HR1 TaxID=1541959 RepID=UPI0004F657D8|nr:2-acyl-glycerophospho-ethanolamine acyltransferase [Candidatus Izimaplasma bacterium HR1]